MMNDATAKKTATVWLPLKDDERRHGKEDRDG
jgi:hypothetical protein